MTFQLLLKLIQILFHFWICPLAVYLNAQKMVYYFLLLNLLILTNNFKLCNVLETIPQQL